ncbi:MAG: ABC transporter permease [Gemmatales bacterium]|nr:MAG: ABC transporter permease [Gemmatales bacterium]
MINSILRYLRLYGALARYSLTREMAFRGNFLVKITVEILWLGILLAFYATIFSKTSVVASWSQYQYLFFIGCYFTLEGILETLFLENCHQFSELVRSGDLDLYLLKPIDEQFLFSCRHVDWSTVPNIFMGCGLMGVALYCMNWQFDLLQVSLFVVALGCGVLMAYSFLFMLTSVSVWLTRNQSLHELWWLLTTLMRYPRDIFNGAWAPMGWFFSFVIPVMLVINVPARVMVKIIEPEMIAWAAVSTIALVSLSRLFFSFALRRYRSASS